MQRGHLLLPAGEIPHRPRQRHAPKAVVGPQHVHRRPQLLDIRPVADALVGNDASRGNASAPGNGGDREAHAGGSTHQPVDVGEGVAQGVGSGSQGGRLVPHRAACARYAPHRLPGAAVHLALQGHGVPLRIRRAGEDHHGGSAVGYGSG
ncbi:hypothetical protein SDC9_205442 [bioreactor metagenome]|uniref:Uncharacterized protein n=1 Tax=bioreactor metagenome TaxID=1076179 RepID=A0A645J246_9ZZZZ